MAKLQRAKRSSPSDPSQFKKKYIRLRVSEEEFEIFSGMAEKRGLTVAELIRTALQALGKDPESSPGTE